MKTIPAQIVKATDLEAHRMSAVENLQRQDLSAIEMIEAIVEIVDAELFEDKQYAAMGKKPADRVKSLLGKLKASRRGKERGYNPNRELRHSAHKFMRRVDQIFKNLPKPLEWLSFLNNDLPILMDICEEVRVGDNPHHRLPPFYTTISAEHGEVDAKEPNPKSRSTLTVDRKKKVGKRGMLTEKILAKTLERPFILIRKVNDLPMDVAPFHSQR